MSLQDQYAPERPPVGGAPAEGDRRRAGTFFMGWLILAASMSLAGNVGHALLIAPSETRWLAALAALVPPIVLLAATHSATWLVRARSVGWVYCSARAHGSIGTGLVCASFDALRLVRRFALLRSDAGYSRVHVVDLAGGDRRRYRARDSVPAVTTRPKRPNAFAHGREQLATASATTTTAAVKAGPGRPSRLRRARTGRSRCRHGLRCHRPVRCHSPLRASPSTHPTALRASGMRSRTHRI